MAPSDDAHLEGGVTTVISSFTMNKAATRLSLLSITRAVAVII